VTLRGLFLSVCDYPDIWLHVDAAWLGAAFSCPENRDRCRVPAINKYADSLDVNFHKVRIILLFYASAIVDEAAQWGLISLDCSGLWVRDRKDLTDALDITPPFLRSSESDAGS
jgi:aromatic-L-amino-acid decarboxylase